MRLDKLTTKFQEALSDAQSLALANDHAYIEPAQMGVSPILARLEAAVCARLSHKVTLDELAAAAGCSPRTLTRRLQAETGLSPMRFVQKVKLDAALRLIRGGDLPLGRIAEQVGLADAATLHRLVVRHTSPRKPGSSSTKSARTTPTPRITRTS